jgi:hypothetical protein
MHKITILCKFFKLRNKNDYNFCQNLQFMQKEVLQCLSNYEGLHVWQILQLMQKEVFIIYFQFCKLRNKKFYNPCQRSKGQGRHGRWTKLLLA